MRIRKTAARLLGSAYSASAAPAPGAAAPAELLLTPPPPSHLAACSAPLESCGWGGYSSHATASGESCELSRSPWDLIADLSLSDPQVEDDLVDRYFVHVTTRASWLFSASMPVSSTKKVAAAARLRAKRRRDAARRLSKKAAASKEKDMKHAEASNKAKVKKEEGEEVPARVYKCKKNDGKRWHCHRTVSQPNTLCNYHFVQKRSYLNPDFDFASAIEPEEPVPVPVPVPAAASKPSSNKPRKKKPSSDFNATEGFYYYAGFGPFRSKRHCRSGGTNEPVPAVKQEEEEVPEDASPPAADQAQTAEDTNRAAPHNDVSSCDDDIAGIAGVDEDSSDDDYDGIGIAGSSMDGSGDPHASNGDGKRKTPWKRWRKPVKARSLKSLM
ncbi:hypothetical protein SEVIR_9G237100v4 [Setaria viridis]|uniref:WRC domain-containing protein n=1 Tax=Setaria viridis TaxID=4556 RepID=A0A4U6T1C0_SETVI|nr:uncharacterized protein LOC117836001 [Setaria viridis]TKV93612.1 hypothetical protein SEVIR_9G237100v2 [Setaria viridis]